MKLTITYQMEPALAVKVHVRPARRFPTLRRLLAKMTHAGASPKHDAKRGVVTRLVPKLEVS